MSSLSFCRSCSNLLYPKEDRARKKLVYACAQCKVEQDAESPVVFRHEVIKSERCGSRARRCGRRRAGSRAHARTRCPPPFSLRSNQLDKVPDGIISDPTLGRENIECPKCMHRGAVFIMPKVLPTDDRIKLIFVCTNA
jgi:DNA-directed RNA polymerase II subunit RPB9